jgi:lipid-A-disaccharide synthase
MAETFEMAIVAGEASGDAHAGGLVRAFGALQPGARWFGAGGGVCRAAGVEILVPSDRLAVVGIGEVLSRLPDLWRGLATIKRALRRRRPRAVVLVDFPDFNFRVARFAHKLGIKVVYYITPQVWAWRPNRTRFMAKNVDRALVLFPFEEPFLKERGVDALFVGHPLVDTAKPATELARFLGRHSLRPETPRVALLPGSRASEVARNLPVLAAAAAKLATRFPDAAMMTPWAQGLPSTLQRLAAGSPIKFIEGEYGDVLGHAQAAAVASGTASLEAALMGVPEVVIYKVNGLTYAIGKRLVTAPYVALPNVVVGRQAVPELIQEDFTPDAVAKALEGFLVDGEASQHKGAELAIEIRNRLGEGNAYARAANALSEFING